MLFRSLSFVFMKFGECFTSHGFILGAGYNRKDRTKWQLLNFAVGQAKLAVYNSRRNKVESRSGYGVLPLFLALVKSRIVFEFKFYKTMNNLEVFESEWCYNNVFCTVVEGELVLASPWG